MKNLGRVSAYDSDSFNDVRAKMLRLTESLGFDPIQATRLTAAFSELCRLGMGTHAGVMAEIGLNLPPEQPALVLICSYSRTVHPPMTAERFFNSVSAHFEPDRTCIEALALLPDPNLKPTDNQIQELQAMVTRPSRAQLLKNIQHKNVELEMEVQERQRTEEALRESEGRIKTVLEGTPDPLIIVDKTGKITYLNTQAEKTFGYTREELLGLNTAQLVPEEFRADHPDKVGSFFARPLEDMSFHLSDAEAVAKDGRRIAVDIKLSPIQTESGVQVIASIRDVTVQKKAQALIKQLSKVVDQSPVSVAITDRSGIIEYVNPAFSEVTGYSAEEAIGRNPRFLKSGKTPAHIYKDLWDSILAGRAWKGIFHNCKKSGEEYWESATIAPIIDESGHITHFVSVKEDVTERMRMEEAVRESEVKYRELVENASSIILKIDREGHITFFNEYAQEFFGYDEEEIIGHSVVGTIVPRYESTGRLLQDLIHNIAQRPDQYSQVENENMCKDGRRVWISWTNRALHDDDTGDFIGVLSVGLDITVQKKAQQERDKAAKELDERNKELAELSNKLSKYLSPQVYASIFSGDWDVELKTTRKKLTVFFSDIKDFTKTTDDMQPEDLTALLNRYFTEMSLIALEYGATIDKFIGDAMLMFFGDPETKGVEEDAKACVRMAIAMQRRMVELAGKWRSEGIEKPFRMRVGINTGYCNVGNFGSQDRMDYTIIGGEVNLAARLEGQADPGGILMSYETYALVNDIIEAEERPAISVKGIRRTVRPYSVLAEYGNLDDCSRFISSQSEGLRIQMDMDKMTSSNRQQAIEDLQKALKRLEGE